MTVVFVGPERLRWLGVSEAADAYALLPYICGCPADTSPRNDIVPDLDAMLGRSIDVGATSF